MTPDDEDRTYKLLFSIRRSVRYHTHRRRFYEGWNVTTIIVAMLGSSSAVTALLVQAEGFGSALPLIAGCIVALMSAIDIAMGTTRQANLHADLSRQFIFLEQQFPLGRDLEDAEYEDLIKSRLQIESNEPPILRLLDAMCHFEILRSLGDRDQHPKVCLCRRILIHFF